MPDKLKAEGFLGVDGVFLDGINCYITVGKRNYYAGFCVMSKTEDIMSFRSFVPTGLKRAYKKYRIKNHKNNAYLISLDSTDYDQLQIVMIMQKYFFDLKSHYEKLQSKKNKRTT